MRIKPIVVKFKLRKAVLRVDAGIARKPILWFFTDFR